MSGSELVVPSVPRSVASIRRYVVATGADLGYVGDPDVLALLVSEVATNALVHGSGEVRVRVQALPAGLRVEIDDDSPGALRARSADSQAEGGRGLALVEALSSSWGVQPRAGGKTVWLEVLA